MENSDQPKLLKPCLKKRKRKKKNFKRKKTKAESLQHQGREMFTFRKEDKKYSLVQQIVYLEIKTFFLGEKMLFLSSVFLCSVCH